MQYKLMSASIVQSPILLNFYKARPLELTLDTGFTSSMVRASSAKTYGFPVTVAS